MKRDPSTCWTVIAGAAAGNREDRDTFARRYNPIIRDYLGDRWRNSACRDDLDDAVQEVFVEFFKPGGVLQRRQDDYQSSFRAFLFGVVLNVARRYETRRTRDRLQPSPSGMDLGALAGSEESQSRLFDRKWAEVRMREAAERQEQHARRDGAAALRRVELLRLRFREGLPIREIAERWQAEAAQLHHEYARAREEFKAALLEVMAFHHPGPPEEMEQECRYLLSLLAKK